MILNYAQQWIIIYMMNGVMSWPYVESKNYSDWQSILQVLPHLNNINGEHIYDANINGIVIRSANDDNVHKAIKYGIWTTTPKNKNKIQQLWYRRQHHGTQTYLFFSAVKSGMFEGVARLASAYHEETFPFWWQNHTLKFKGYFKIEWVYIKDVNNKHFMGLYNCDGEQVVKSKDCDILDPQTTNKMLDIIDKKKAKRNIFMDFAYMDQREVQYIRKLYEATYYNHYNHSPYNNTHRYDLSQINLAAHQIGTINGSHQNNAIPGPNLQPVNGANQSTMPLMMGQVGGMGQIGGIGQIGGMGQVGGMAGLMMPSAMMRPNVEIPGSNLGFQMNPVSKNSKKK